MCDIIFASWIIHYTWLWSIFDVKHYVLNDLLSVISRFSVKCTDPVRLVCAHYNIVSVYVRTCEIIHFRQMKTVSCYRCYYYLYINPIARWSHELENAFFVLALFARCAHVVSAIGTSINTSFKTKRISFQNDKNTKYYRQ